MGAFRVPKQIQLHGQTIKTKRVDQLAVRNDAVGMAHYRINEINIQANTSGYPMGRTQEGEAYCHEFVHHILDHMGEDELKQNEKFVELFGQLLFQGLDSAKYGADK